ncbi:MAG TPA: hypothetical protein VHL11_12640 [Phototrophicaceae bacterium]|jgi:hypothetical protein|nr:hypothetical protein [Phototrophicaceae bacterium]
MTAMLTMIRSTTAATTVRSKKSLISVSSIALVVLVIVLGSILVPSPMSLTHYSPQTTVEALPHFSYYPEGWRITGFGFVLTVGELPNFMTMPQSAVGGE